MIKSYDVIDKSFVPFLCLCETYIIMIVAKINNGY